MTPMQQLLNQLRDEREKLPMPIEWDRCYQSIEMMIKSVYLPMEQLPKQDVDKFEKFLDNEIELGLSPKDTIERIKWYYKTYFKQPKKD